MDSEKITITWCVPLGYMPGDYARLYGNGGEGEIDYDTPLTNEKFDLFPDGGGIYGWGLQPWGLTPWGLPWSTHTPGWGLQPWGLGPWGYGTAVIKAQYIVQACGDYKFALKIFDKLGNPNEGSPQELEAVIHIAPPAPTGLKKVSYDKDTDILVLEAA